MSSGEISSGFCVVIVAKETVSFALQCMGHLCHAESATERHRTSGIDSERREELRQNIEAKNFRPSLFEGVGKPQQKSPGSLLLFINFITILRHL